MEDPGLIDVLGATANFATQAISSISDLGLLWARAGLEALRCALDVALA